MTVKHSKGKETVTFCKLFSRAPLISIKFLDVRRDFGTAISNMFENKSISSLFIHSQLREKNKREQA